MSTQTTGAKFQSLRQISHVNERLDFFTIFFSTGNFLSRSDICRSKRLEKMLLVFNIILTQFEEVYCKKSSNEKKLGQHL